VSQSGAGAFPGGRGECDAVCTFMTIGENKPNEVVYFPKRGTVRIRATGEVLKIPKSQGHRNGR
jgi:hypothetical protein